MKLTTCVSVLLVLVAIASSVQSSQYFVTRYFSDSKCSSSVLSKTLDATINNNCFQLDTDYRMCDSSNNVLTCLDGNCTACTLLQESCEIESDGNSNSMSTSCETEFNTVTDPDLALNGGGWTYSFNDSLCNTIDSAVYYNPVCISYEGGSGIYYCDEGDFHYTDCEGSSDCSGSCKTYTYDDMCAPQESGGYRTSFCTDKTSNSNLITFSGLLVASMFVLSFLF